MKMTYDPKGDALYIKLREAKIEESDNISEEIIIDYDSKGKPVGIEFLDAAKIFGGRKEMHVEMALSENLKN